MSPNVTIFKRKPEIAVGEFRATLFGACFASTVALVGIAVGMKPTALSGIAALHQKACTENPALLGWTQHALPIREAVLSLLVLLPLLCAGWTLARHLREGAKLNRQVQRNSGPLPSKLAAVARSLQLSDRIICVQDQELYAFCFGILCPRICVSSTLARRLSKSELEAVLLHESSHLVNRDPLRLLVTRIAASALVLLPAAREIRERFHLSTELAADRMAIARLPVEVLASALLKVFTGSSSKPQYRFANAVALDVTRERIIRLTGNGSAERIPPVPRFSLVASTFVALALFAGTVGFSEAAGYWADRGHVCRPVPSVSVVKTSQLVESKTSAQRCSHGDERLEIPTLK